MNRRILAVMKKYMNIIEVEEIRVRQYGRHVRTDALLYDGNRPKVSFRGRLQDVSHKIVFAERLLLPTTVLEHPKNPLLEHFYSLKMVKEVVINGFLNKEVVSLMKKYGAESLSLTGKLRENHGTDDWSELLEQDITLTHISITSPKIEMNNGFAEYIRAKKVNSMKLSGYVLTSKILKTSDFQILLNELQIAIDSKRPINWDINATSKCLDSTILDKFLKKNKKSIKNVTKYDDYSNGKEIKSMSIQYAEGQATFLQTEGDTDSYLDYSDRIRQEQPGQDSPKTKKLKELFMVIVNVIVSVAIILIISLPFVFI